MPLSPEERSGGWPLAGIHFIRSTQAGKARCEPGWHWRPQPLTDYDLWYAMSGKGRMVINGESYPIAKGTCFLVRPGDTPEAVQDLDDRLTVIFIHFSAIDSLQGNPYDPQLMPQRCTRIGDTFFFEVLLNRLLQTIHGDGAWYEAEFQLLLSQLLLHLFRRQLDDDSASTGKHKQLMNRVIGYIREDIGRRMSHEEIAEQVQLSPEYLSILFKKYTGTSMKEYMTKARLERAMHLLMETPMNVTQVSEALGYSNVYLFSKQFKEHYGSPPSVFKWKSQPSEAHKSPNP